MKGDLTGSNGALTRALRPAAAALAIAGWAHFSPAQVESTDPFAATFGGTLHWRHGESTAGNLRESSDRELVWDSEYFREPMTLRHPFIKSIESAEAAKKPADPWRLRLADGDVICGEITGADAKEIRLKSSRAGAIAVVREKILSAERIAGGPERLAAGAFLLGGPTEDGWGQAGQTTGKAFWKSGRHGTLAVPYWSRSIFLPMKFPARTEVDIVLRSSERPRFAIGLDKNDFGKAFVETWDDELVLSHVARFAPLRTLKDSDRTVALKWCWDSDTGAAFVFSDSGKLLGSLTGVAKPSDYASGGLLIQNRGRNLVVESLRVRQWSGKPPAAGDPAKPHVEMADGSTISGSIESSDGKTLVIRAAGGGMKTVPLAQADKLALMSAAGDDGKPQPQAAAELWFATGEIITGKLIAAKNGTIEIHPAWSPKPVAAVWKGLRSLRLPPGPEPLPPVGNTDRLVISGTQFRGAFSPSGGDKLRWLPVGGVNPVEITLWPHLEIIRAAAPASQRQPALFFSKNGEVIAGEMQGMNELFVNVKPAFAPPSPLPVSGINAVQFAGPPLQASGFGDPGWRTLKGDDKNVIRNGSKVTINPGGSFGHLSILQGDEALFRFEPVNGFGTLRLRLFTADPASAKQGLSLLLMHYGSQVYAGVDRGDRQGFFRENIQRRVPRGQPTRVRIAFGKAAASLFINEVPAGDFPIEAENSAGSGIIFESAAVNGNNEFPMAVSDFEIKADPQAAWSPAIDPVAKENALAVPRFRRESPPRHVLVAQNGDLLRGTVESATASRIRIRTGVDTVEVPRERIAALVWLRPAPGKSDAAADKSAAAAELAPVITESWKEAAKSPWFQLYDGTRLRLTVEKMEKDRIIGAGALLGRCELPLDLIASIHISAPQPSRAMLSYQRWSLANTPDPVLPDGGGDASPLAGTTPDDFTLPLAEGGDFNLSKHRGKVVVLDFWATWCGPCVMSMPGLITAMKTFPPDKAVFVAVNQGEPADLVKRFLVQRHWELSVALDADQKVARKFAVQSIPHTVVIGPDGKIAHVAIGYQADGAEKIAEVVRRLMP